MALTEFVERVIARLEQTPVDLAVLSSDTMAGSIFSGGAGIAFFLHEMARLRGDRALLARARQWCDVTQAWVSRATTAQWNHMPHGFFQGAAGLPYVEALLCLHEADHGGVLAAVQELERIALHLPEGELRGAEYLGGAAGIVGQARDLDARLPCGADYAASREVVDRVRSHALAVLLAKHAVPLAPSERDYLGFAHGIAGELWGLVVALGADHPVVGARLEELEALGELDEDGLVYWLPRPGSEDLEFLGSWCHGMAGHTLLWCEVARQTRRPEAIERARRCAESAAILQTTSPTICCGLAGHALALQRYADLSGDRRVARIAYRRLARSIALAEKDSSTEFPALWQGVLGIALVAAGRLGDEATVAGL